MDALTIRHILGDPDFDPGIIFEDALKDFVKKNPAEVAKRDKVALKWLVKDPEVVAAVAEYIDVRGDVEMVPDTIMSLQKIRYLGSRERYVAGFMKRFTLAPVESINALVEGILRYPSIPFSWYPVDLLDRMSRDQVSSIISATVNEGNTACWKAEDWRPIVDNETGMNHFIDALEKEAVFLDDTGILHIISQCAKKTKDPRHIKVLNDFKAGDNFYRCFACGRAPIKSISGYTLHRKRCDPRNRYPSPHEIFHGEPKELSFECSTCGETFSTQSGCTLHEKNCK